MPSSNAVDMSEIFHTIHKRIKAEVNYMFFRRYRYWRVVFRHLRKYYTPDAPRSTSRHKTIVYMADGRYLHGGFADRLRSILTDYRYCRDHGLRFAINYTFPFRLEDYLEPAAYDWRLQPGELTYNSHEACAVFMETGADESPREMAFCHRMADRMFNRQKLQIHAYGALFWSDDDFSALFHELFRPVPAIQTEIDLHLRNIGGKFVSVSTRFMELLGDFAEPKSGTVLSPEQQQALIGRCRGIVEEIARQNPDATAVLVTSDSKRFLDACSSLPYVYVIPGKIAHSDTSVSTDHTKTIVDFLMISHAAKAYQVVGGGMYGGNFSLRAAQTGGIPYERINF